MGKIDITLTSEMDDPNSVSIKFGNLQMMPSPQAYASAPADKKFE